MLEDFEVSRVESFFGKVAPTPNDDVSGVVITHLLAERPTFLRAVGRVCDIASVLPKPKSIDHTAQAVVANLMKVDPLDRQRFSDPDAVLQFLESRAAGRRLILLDVGGYFAPTLTHVCARFSGELIGVVEDTENGHQRYASLEKLPCPVFSVARSPLKDPEDFLVGQSITFSTEALIRTRGDILNGRNATVIGYGKIGRSIAAMLHAKHVTATIYDHDPVKRTQALSQGFRTTHTLRTALTGAGLVICATGNLSLREDDFASIANGAYIASVTSSDDELELDTLNTLYTRTPNGDHITRYSRTGHYFYVLAGGNAVNFLHGASVGAFIFLVQAEILAALAVLAGSERLEPGLHELDKTGRSRIAELWLHHFDRTT
ncbi:adenosylhomocysteinase [Actinocorallia sp. API 0066]|uniref:adenosylhomocysteinase n=1 Tax=Actinocorallia sp. API 0066 TaxID=2896846 RepID=UPI001E444798|nr:adenosylhomocysteinase [Actinocorallia sp. API 0066]MCD0451339.1 adenosylhomocysteinase [Actinocorallia sp. API 0066]